MPSVENLRALHTFLGVLSCCSRHCRRKQSAQAAQYHQRLLHRRCAHKMSALRPDHRGTLLCKDGGCCCSPWLLRSMVLLRGASGGHTLGEALALMAARKEHPVPAFQAGCAIGSVWKHSQVRGMGVAGSARVGAGTQTIVMQLSTFTQQLVALVFGDLGGLPANLGELLSACRLRRGVGPGFP